ncbi:MAG: two-component regulator propeller domain-containing protein [Bacteroidales bacterium]|nr:two-component regulator propeller domain-containing protein [Bacteroidales bacterium]
MHFFKQVILFLFLTISLSSYSQIPVGSWRTHLTYASVTQVAETPEKVYGISDGALFSYTKEDNNVDVYTKIDGLSDNKISLISYSVENKLLFIIYDNANIDLLTDDGKIFNLPDIKSKNAALNKTINGVTFIGSNAYLSTGYGISIINLIKHEIADTYLLNKKTYSSILFENKLYAATESGIMVANASSNLVDPGNWTLALKFVAHQLVVFKNQLIGLNYEEGLATISGNTYNIFYPSNVLSGLVVSNDMMVAYGQWQVSYFTSTSEEKSISVTDLFGISALSANQTTWLANGSNGITKITKTADGFEKVDVGIRPDGPLANSPYKLRFSKNKLMIVGGGAWDDRFDTKGLMMFFENNKWSFQKVDTIIMDNVARDFVDIVEDPREVGHYFVSSYGEGLYEFRNQRLVKKHDHTNSIIETHELVKGADHYDRVYALLYDKDNNLFVSNMHTAKTFKVLTKDGQWIALNYAPIANKETVFEIIQNKRGVYWSLNSTGGTGLFVFDTKGTLANQADDQYKFLTEINYLDNLETKSISPEIFFCLAEDKNGAIWVGTDMGPIVFNSPSKVFTDNFLGSRIKVPRNDGTQLADYLLEGEKIRVICVDGGNRKWIGTEENGVYLVSENGQETLFHFTSDNSPLLSNKVLSIAIHPLTGEVFIGTDKGLVSYRSDAIEGKKSYSNVYAFPNPVQPNYEGLITITGLIANSTVRITDITGNSIFEGQSEGGQISWNGRNRKGEHLASGVYLVYSAISEALDGVVTKILIIK